MPAPESRPSPEEILVELFALDTTIERKLDREAVPPEVARKFVEELRPRLEQCRELVARGGSRAPNACLDTLVAYREFAFTSLVTDVTLTAFWIAPVVRNAVIC